MGQRTSKTVGSDTTTYDYDELGNLVSVGLAAKTVSYVVDGFNRRVARKVDGTVTNRYLYGQGLLPVAELNSDGGVKSRFVFASKAHVPDYMVRGGVTYRFVTDQVGSVRLVVNTSDGTLAQRIDYDPFGVVTSDTNPGFQPFGFAGGLYDADTGLVRFGARDYDAETGRWTAKDPIGFEGGDTNLYGYVGGDPVNRIDPVGLDWLEDLNDSVGGLADGLTTIPFTDISLTESLRNHMVDGGIAVDVDKCSWGYGYSKGVGETSQGGLFIVAGGASAASSLARQSSAAAPRITGYTRHGLQQAMGRDGAGVSPRAILDTVRTGVVSPGTSAGSIEIAGKDAVVVLSDSGRVITTWARNRGAWRIHP
jgi:RHS repeat-associated protein